MCFHVLSRLLLLLVPTPRTVSVAFGQRGTPAPTAHPWPANLNLLKAEHFRVRPGKNRPYLRCALGRKFLVGWRPDSYLSSLPSSVASFVNKPRLSSLVLPSPYLLIQIWLSILIFLNVPSLPTIYSFSKPFFWIIINIKRNAKRN